jgi:hypothetical protein
MFILAQVSSFNNPHYKHFKEPAIARTNNNENVYKVLKSYTSKESKGLSRGLYFGKVVNVKVKDEIVQFFKPYFKLDLLNKTYTNILNGSQKPIGYLKDLKTPADIVNYVAINSASIILELIRKTIKVGDTVTYIDDKSNRIKAKVDSIDKVKGIVVVVKDDHYSEINTYQIVDNHGKDL